MPSDNFLGGVSRGLGRGLDLRNAWEQGNRSRQRFKWEEQAESRKARDDYREQKWFDGIRQYDKPDGTVDWKGLKTFTRLVNPGRLADVLAWEQSALQNRAATRSDAAGQRSEDRLQQAITASPTGVPSTQDLSDAAAVGGNVSAYRGLQADLAAREKEKQANLYRQALGKAWTSGGTAGVVDAAMKAGDIDSAADARKLGSEITEHSNKQREREESRLAERMVALYRSANNNFLAVYPVLRNDVRQNNRLFTEMLGLDPDGPRQVVDVDMQEIDGEFRLVPIIQNHITGTVGPMTESATPHGGDTVLSLTSDQLMGIFTAWSGGDGKKSGSASGGALGPADGKKKPVPGTSRFLFDERTGRFITVPDADNRKAMENLATLLPVDGISGQANSVARGHVARLAQEMQNEGFNPNAAVKHLVPLIAPGSEYGKALADAEDHQEVFEVYQSILIAARGKLEDVAMKEAAGILKTMVQTSPGRGKLIDGMMGDIAEAAEKQGLGVGNVAAALVHAAQKHPESTAALSKAYGMVKTPEEKRQVIESLLRVTIGVDLDKVDSAGTLGAQPRARPPLPSMPRRPGAQPPAPAPAPAPPPAAAPSPLALPPSQPPGSGVPVPSGSLPRIRGGGAYPGRAIGR